MKIDDVIIVGAGPAGMAAALQLKRYGLEPLVLEQAKVGGLLRNANLVENYLGCSGGISGPELVETFREHLDVLAVDIHQEEVLRIQYLEDTFRVDTDKRSLRSRLVIIASGTRPLELPDIDIPPEIKDRVFYEVHSLDQVADERFAIIGAGDAAFDYAENLARSNDVQILNRGTEVKCLPLLYSRCIHNPSITYHEAIQLNSIEPSESGLTLHCTGPTGKRVLEASYLVVAIGREPALDILSDELLEVLPALLDSKVLYLIGDVWNEMYRQTAIAVGDGVRAAMELYRKMEGMGP